MPDLSTRSEGLSIASKPIVAQMKLTDELLRAACPSGAWTKAQLAALGITYPLQTAWKQRVIGKEISDEDYQRLCELVLVRVKPKKERAGVPEKPMITGQPPDGMNELVAWLTDRLEIEKVARAELEKQVSVLQFQLQALCNEVREAHKSLTDHDSGSTPTLPQKTPTTPPWEV